MAISTSTSLSLITIAMILWVVCQLLVEAARLQSENREFVEGSIMPIGINLDVMLARRKIKGKALAAGVIFLNMYLKLVILGCLTQSRSGLKFALGWTDKLQSNVDGVLIEGQWT